MPDREANSACVLVQESLLEWLANNYKKVGRTADCRLGEHSSMLPLNTTRLCGTCCKLCLKGLSVRMQFGCQLEFVTNKSQEGSQFCRGFGGIGGILRYSVDTTLNEVRRPAGSRQCARAPVVSWRVELSCMPARACGGVACELLLVVCPGGKGAPGGS